MMQSTDDLLSQLRPITGPEGVPPPEGFDWLMLTGWIGAIVAVMIIGYWWWLRRHRPISPRDEAMTAIRQLPTEPSAPAMATLDRVVRRWLGRVHCIDGDHATGREMLHQLPQSVAQSWSAIFAQLEPGRFSRDPLTVTQWTALINEIRQLISAPSMDLAGSVAG